MLVVKNLQKQFGDFTALRDISFSVPAGEIVALIGPNGAGKTTTFRIVCGLLSVTSGSIGWVGSDVAPSAIQSGQIGFLPEERGLYQDVTVQALMRYWAKLRRLGADSEKVIDEWLDKMDLHSKRTELVSALSKGNQQKIQLSLCLMHKPALLVLDEPFSGLDPVNQELISNTLKNEAERGAAILISAHQLSLVESMADRVFILEGGHVISEISMSRTFTVDARNADSWDAAVLLDKNADSKLIVEFLNETCKVIINDGDKMRMHVKFENLSMADFFQKLAMLSDFPGVLDIRTERTNLHQTYMKLVGKEKFGSARQ